MSSVWAGIGNAEIFERGNYMKPNFVGVIRIKATRLKNTQKSGLGFICEMEVLESNMPAVHPIGSKTTWFQKMIDKNVAFPAVAAWAAACMGMDPNDKEGVKSQVLPILEQVMEIATDNPDNPEANPFINSVTRLETVATVTKEEKRDFTRYDFTPYRGPMPALQ